MGDGKKSTSLANQYTCYNNIHIHYLYTAFQWLPTHCLKSHTFSHPRLHSQTGPFNTAETSRYSVYICSFHGTVQSITQPQVLLCQQHMIYPVKGKNSNVSKTLTFIINLYLKMDRFLLVWFLYMHSTHSNKQSKF